MAAKNKTTSRLPRTSAGQSNTSAPTSVAQADVSGIVAEQSAPATQPPPAAQAPVAPEILPPVGDVTAKADGAVIDAVEVATISVKAAADGYRRGGRAWAKTMSEPIPVSEFSEEQRKQIMSDAKLQVICHASGD